MYKVLDTSHSTLLRYVKRQERYDELLDACAKIVDEYRLQHPGGGLVKIYDYLRYVATAKEIIGISRDRFVRGMKARGRLLKLSPPRPKTTRSGSYRFDNQTRGMIVEAPNQLWVSDTTYYLMRSGHWCYLTFVLDVFSRRIIGYATSDSLAADANVDALQMAIETRGTPLLSRQDIKLVFHSDGGKQFSAEDFLGSLKQVNAQSSMCFVAQENAFAERVNGIIKGEFLAHWSQSRKSISKLRLSLAAAVDTYNTMRLHNSLPGKICPVDFEMKYAEDERCGYSVLVKEWIHDPYSSTDKFTGTNPQPESVSNTSLQQHKVNND